MSAGIGNRVAVKRRGMPGPLVLYVHDLRGSGVVTNAIALARRMGRERETILVAGYGKGLNRDVDVSPASLAILSDAEAGDSRWEEAKRLRSFLRKRGASVAASMGNLGHRTFRVATTGLALKKVYRISNEVARPGKPYRNFKRWFQKKLLLATADRVVLVGHVLASLPIFARALATGRAIYIPNGIDLENAQRQLRNAGEVERHPDEPRIVSIGRIHPQKNLAQLIHAFALANRQIPMRLVLVGGGKPKRIDELVNLSSDLGVSDRVEFAGETKQVFARLKSADLFALVSLWEGSSTALLEALAAQVPVIASRQAGDAAHVLDDGRYGVLVDANDSEDIARGILRQVGESPVLPGRRAEQFDLRQTHDAYAAMFAAL